MSQRSKAARRPSSSTPAAEHAPTGRMKVIAVVIIVLLASLTAWTLWPRGNAVRSLGEPPNPDLSQASPAVAQLVASTRNDVLANPTSAESWGELGMVFLAHQFEQPATDCFAAAAELDPQDYRWPYLLAMNLGASDPQRAKEQYRAALKLEPDKAIIHFRLGELLLGQQDLEAAKQSLAAGLALEPDNARAMVGMARIGQWSGDLLEGLSWANKAAQAHSKSREVYAVLAQLHRLAGNKDEARQARENTQRADLVELMWNDRLATRVLEMRRDSEWMLTQAEQMLSHGRVNEALQTLSAAIEADDRNPQLYTAMAKILIQAHQFEPATQLLERAVRRHPGSAEIAFQAGTNEFFKGQFERARQQFQKAVAGKPDYALAHYNLGHTYLKLNDKKAALSAFLSTVSIRPTHAMARANAGRLLLDNDELEPALQQLRIASELEPDNAFVRETRAEAERRATQGPER